MRTCALHILAANDWILFVRKLIKANRIAINYWQISLELAYPVLKGRVLKSEFFTNLNGLWSQAIQISKGLLYTE